MVSMKQQSVNPVKVILNTTNRGRHQWGQIRCAKTGRIRHTGQVNYIRYVAKKKYGVKVSV